MHDDSTPAAMIDALRDLEAALHRFRSSVLHQGPRVADVAVVACLGPTADRADDVLLRIALVDDVDWPIAGALATLEYPSSGEG